MTSIDTSLETMGLDYIDMMIIHSPKPWAQFHEEKDNANVDFVLSEADMDLLKNMERIKD